MPLGNYNVPQTRIFVDPPELYEIGVKVNARGEDIVALIRNISNIWADLKLGWAGSTATEAEDFAARWTRTADAFFGKEGDTRSVGSVARLPVDGLADIVPGVLPKVVTAIQLAAANYGQSEDFVVKMFDEMAAALGKEDGGEQPDVHRDLDLGPIKENTEGEPNPFTSFQPAIRKDP